LLKRMAGNSSSPPRSPMRREVTVLRADSHLRHFVLPGCGQLSALPLEGGAHNRLEVVELRLPSEDLAHALGARDQDRRITGAAGLLANLQRPLSNLFHGAQDLAHAVAVPITAVERARLTAVTQVSERCHVRAGQILDVDVVAHAGAVGRLVVGAEDRHSGTL